ncbi:MAG: cytochrome c oxidase subunit II [Candidatus Sericytochromatia bacterium]
MSVFLVGLFLGTLFLPGAMNGPMSIMDVNGPVAVEQRTVFWFTVGVSAFLLLTVGGVFLYAIFRFRAKPGQDFHVPEQTHGSAKVEVALIVASCLLLLVIAIPNAKALFYVSEVPEARKAEQIKVIAIGHQWWWEFQYPDLGITTANELHIPVGKPIDLQIKAVDVIHAFWVPRLAGKIDATPGQINTMWMEASEPGTYKGQCTEYCGDSHANMRFLVMAEKQEDFDTWARNTKKDGAKPSTVEEVNGQQVFMKGCNSCHTVGGSGAMGVVGPNLSHFGSRTTLGAGIYVSNEENLTNWIKFPKQMKPGNLMNLEQVNMVVSDKDVKDLVAYLKSLK